MRYCFRVTAAMKLCSVQLFGFDHHSPVQIAALQTKNQHFCRGKVCRAGDIVHIAEPECAHDALIFPGIRVVRVGEHDNQINLIVRNARVHLLMAALIFRQEQRDGKIGCL